MRAFSIFSIPDDLPNSDRQLRRHMLARLGLAWLVMMQVMTLAFPGYLRSESMAADNLALLDQAITVMNWISLLLTIPVITYCSWPVWRSASLSLRKINISMDVPVAVGILVAFVPSVISTYTSKGEVYFESVSMFVAFLLTARYLELCARQSIGTQTGSNHSHIEQLRTKLSLHSNKVALWFVIGQLSLAFIVGAVWFVYAPQHSLAVMVALIVISCPCAMAMSVPTAVAAAHASLRAIGSVGPSQLIKLEHNTARISKQNLYGSVIWHLLVTPLAVVGLVAPWLAAITMLISSLAVAGNSVRLYRNFVRTGGTDASNNHMVQGIGA